MPKDSKDTQVLKYMHCFAEVKFARNARKVRCGGCNTLILIERKSLEELKAVALEDLLERIKRFNCANCGQNVQGFEGRDRCTIFFD